ncbi:MULTISPECIES: hypothetical protein [unclassified Streptomyces]|uniref:hypothetical protein n=1 Tax=unclassified Streptomyces TaxID=2593676 RepID=UPI000DB96003|nr:MULTISPECIES: hypothetical protein [unclassified Streptomyces]MYT73425.1 hypothetical protein [Streptomyces sp. SID8367]
MAADGLIFFTTDGLGLVGTVGRIQIICFVGLALLWAVNFLVSRPRQLRAFGSAVPVEDPSVLRPNEEQTRHLRRGRVRVAAFVLLVTLGSAYVLQFPFFGLGIQLVLCLGLVHTWRTTFRWERRHGVHLWKPALSAVGRENWRRSPYYATPSRPISLAHNS